MRPHFTCAVRACPPSSPNRLPARHYRDMPPHSHFPLLSPFFVIGHPLNPARPYHNPTLGMSEPGQHCTGIIIDQDGNIDALDTYGLTPLHRMCINDFAVGAEALLKAGASPTRRTEAGAGSELRGKTPMEVRGTNYKYRSKTIKLNFN